MKFDEPKPSYEKPNGYNTRADYVEFTAQQYRTVVEKIGIAVPINIWGYADDWQVTLPDCECGDPVHGKRYWRTFDDSITGYLLMCHCNTAYAKCFVDAVPVKPDLSRLQLNDSGYFGDIMMRVDGEDILVDGLGRH